MVELKDHSSRSAAAEKVTLDSRSVDAAQRTLSVDTSGLGPAIPLSELKEGDFVVAVGRTEVASGIIRNMEAKGGKLRLSLNIHNSPARPYETPPFTWANDVISVHRVEPKVAVREPSRFARFFGAKAQSYPIAAQVSEIFGETLPLERIGIEDQGLPILIEEHGGYHWSIQTIVSVEESGLHFEAAFGVEGLRGVHMIHRSRTITARIFR